MAGYEYDPVDGRVLVHTDVMEQRAPHNPTEDLEHDSGTHSVALASLDDFRALSGTVVTEEVFVPLLKRKVIARAPTAEDVVTARLASNTQKSGRTIPRADRDFATHLVYLCTVTPDGDRFFPPGYVSTLVAEIPYGAIQPIAQVILRLGGFDDEANEKSERDAFS